MRTRMVPVMEFDCPFCGGQFGVSEKEYFVYHVEPPCVKFLTMEATEFLHAVNLAYGNYGYVRGSENAVQ